MIEFGAVKNKSIYTLNKFKNSHTINNRFDFLKIPKIYHLFTSDNI